MVAGPALHGESSTGLAKMDQAISGYNAARCNSGILLISLMFNAVNDSGAACLVPRNRTRINGATSASLREIIKIIKGLESAQSETKNILFFPKILVEFRRSHPIFA